MYKLIKIGGSLGDNREPKLFETKEEAQEAGKRWKNSFSPTERKYYRVHYQVKEVK